jgi:replicative DNA helicase
MSRQEVMLISAIVKGHTLRNVTREGISSEQFTQYKDEMQWLEGQKVIPSRSVFQSQFPDFPFRRSVRLGDVPTIIEQLREIWLTTQLANTITATSKKIATRKRKASSLDLITTLHEQTGALLERTSSGGVVDIIQDGPKIAKGFQKRQLDREKGLIQGVSTGMPSIDMHTGGLLNQMLYLVIARQGQAKTYLMLYWACRAVLEGKRILWVSREMPEDMVALRVHSILSTYLRGPDNSFSNLSLILGRDDIDYNDYRKFLLELRKNIQGSFIIPSNRRISVAQLRYYLERYNCDICFYDYIGIIGSSDSSRSWQELGAQASLAKELAMEYDVPMVMASQVNRKNADSGEAPMVENIAFADTLGYAGDQIIALQLSEVRDDQGRQTLEVWLRKQRYGAGGINVQVYFDGDRGHFLEVPNSLEGIKKDLDPAQKEKKQEATADRRRARKERRAETAEVEGGARRVRRRSKGKQEVK